MLCSLHIDGCENRAPQGPSGVLRSPDLDDYENRAPQGPSGVWKMSLLVATCQVHITCNPYCV